MTIQQPEDDNKHEDSSQSIQIKADDWIPAMLHLIQDGKELRINPQGNSMYPFLRSKRDSVILKLPDREFKRGDIVLYRRDNGLHIVHRIHHVGKEGYYMVGDNQREIEGPLRKDQLLAITVKIIRKNKLIDCRKNVIYRILSSLWLLVLPFRLSIIRLWEKLYWRTHKKKRK